MRTELLLSVTFLGLTACGTGRVGASDVRPGPGPGDPAAEGGTPAGALAAGPAIVRGTAVDASSGRPLAGVRIEGPGGLVDTSDPDGRFELAGLPLGVSGELVARTDDGRTGRNKLRPLTAGALEVVVFVRSRRP